MIFMMKCYDFYDEYGDFHDEQGDFHDEHNDFHDEYGDNMTYQIWWSVLGAGVVCHKDYEDFHDKLIEHIRSSSCPTHMPVYYKLSVNRYDE